MLKGGRGRGGEEKGWGKEGLAKGEGRGGEGGREEEREGNEGVHLTHFAVLLFEPVLGSSVDSLPEVLNYLAYCSLDHVFLPSYRALVRVRTAPGWG